MADPKAIRANLRAGAKEVFDKSPALKAAHEMGAFSDHTIASERDGSLYGYLFALDALYTPYREALKDEPNVRNVARLSVWDDDERALRTLRQAKTIWPALRQARIFEIPRKVFGDIFSQVDRYTTEEVAGLNFVPGTAAFADDGVFFQPTPNVTWGKEETTHYLHRIQEATKGVSYPDRLPFDWCYFSYGTGVGIPEHQVEELVGGSEQYQDMRAKGYTTCLRLADLVGHNGNAWTLYAFGDYQSERRELHFDGLLTPWTANSGQWVRAFSLDPWILTSLVDLVHTYKTFVEEQPRGMKYRAEIKKIAKRFRIKKPIPPPYYTVRLKQDMIEARLSEQFPSTRPKREYSHRFDRRGHERCLFRRGKLPLDPKKETKLRKRGYKIFANDPVDLATYRRLAERGMPRKGHDEWLATKSVWIDNQVIGDQSKPYRPAIRKF